MRVLVAYDVSHDARRAHVSAILQGWGDRVQKSVFLCELGPEELTDVVGRIGDLIDPQTDALLALKLCATCHDGATFLGQYHEPPSSPCWIVL